MSELVMVGESIPKNLKKVLDSYVDPSESEDEEDEIEHESYDIPFNMEYTCRPRSYTASRLEKLDQARKRAAKIKHVKWEQSGTKINEDSLNDMFTKKTEITKPVVKKSMLSELLEKCPNLPKNPYAEYEKFDGSAQVGVTVRKYKIFLSMLPEAQRNYPMIICCIATAKIYELIGLILLKCR